MKIVEELEHDFFDSLKMLRLAPMRLKLQAGDFDGVEVDFGKPKLRLSQVKEINLSKKSPKLDKNSLF